MNPLVHILPVLGIIALGYAIHRSGLIDESGYRGINRLGYYVLFPVLIFLTLAKADFEGLAFGRVTLALAAPVLLVILLSLAVRPWVCRWSQCTGPAFTSFFQGSVRWNSMLSLAIAGGLYGLPGLTLTGVAVIAMVPLLNIASVLVLAKWANGERSGLRELARAVGCNPLILACIVGMVANLSGLRPHGFILETLDLLATSAIAIALLATGAGLRLRQLAKPEILLLASSVIKLIVMPAVGLLATHLLGLEGTSQAVCIIMLAVPTASSCYVLAKEMGGDDLLMSRITTFQTALSMLTLPLWIAIIG